MLIECPPPVIMTVTVTEADGTVYEQDGTVAFKCRHRPTLADLVFVVRRDAVKFWKDVKSR